MQNSPHNEKNRDFFVSEWMKHVADDELNVRAIMKDRDGTPAQACFLSQQMAEKSLKALLLHLTGDYPKIHALPQIVVMLDGNISGVAELLKDDATLLNPYYVTTRYMLQMSLLRVLHGKWPKTHFLRPSASKHLFSKNLRSHIRMDLALSALFSR